MCSREIFTKKCLQQQIFDSDLKGAWRYNHVTFTPIAKYFLLYCRLIYMLSILCVRLTIKVKVGIPESFKVGEYPPKKTGSSHLKKRRFERRMSTGSGLFSHWTLSNKNLVVLRHIKEKKAHFRLTCFARKRCRLSSLMKSPRWGTPYNGLFGEAPPEGVTFSGFRYN